MRIGRVLPLLLGAALSAYPVRAGEVIKPKNLVPSADKVSAAYKIAESMFDKLKAGKSEEIAKWLTEEIGQAWDAQTKVKNIGDFRSKLDMILLSPPGGTYGKLTGYDLIEESSLPGTDRYFRLTFLSYHEASPLLWQFRFYVQPGGQLHLTYCGWDGSNPFEYLATGDMQLQRWYGRQE